MTVHAWLCPLCGFKASGVTAHATIASREDHLLFHLLTDPANPAGSWAEGLKPTGEPFTVKGRYIVNPSTD